jgi:NADH ubiquinone oxidoreductase, 20 Kd subunit
MTRKRKPKLAVWKFASCDGCQLSLLDCEDELMTLADSIEIAYFPEASRAKVKGPYDLSLVEGSITTPHDARLIQHVRQFLSMFGSTSSYTAAPSTNISFWKLSVPICTDGSRIYLRRVCAWSVRGAERSV